MGPSLINLCLGRLDEGYARLEQAMEERDGILIMLSAWSLATRIADDPRYQAVLDRLGLELAPRFRKGAAPERRDQAKPEGTP